ncbi:hypothetical protein PF005_g26675 [Phytophthora fragariae]|uniref:HAT C-terminal dimerisation domain-containing protein n=1 Tax=Phytophthora fragariae TaxID=53985 RepID=A0A6A4BIX6_9STRA|nr:hypothetical protein PF003_g38401 [Phytophthora fragariae]KAE8922494.1 hypothetical protein PF009_g27245 [Phytophthora fragariae]KAE9069862.1 hypothetical protein PF010_g26507 [Phytophthora fragariae]KAE9071585.1 hypothetical protein PF007_g26497 [Phytophthora fragariae]KAE9087132.1 hypothetical protein PF006_g25874 [Phytophthora fragariae]
MAVPVLRTIERKIKDEEMFEPITRSVGNEAFVPRVKTLMQSVRRTYVTLFTERFKEKLPKELLWISALDPRSAELKHLSHEDAKTAIAHLKVAVFEMGKNIRATQSASEEDSRVVQDSSRPPSAAQKNVAWLTEVFSGGTERYEEEAPTVADDKLKDECDSQVQQYLGDAHGTRVTTDALQWWSTRRGKYPIVEALARKWLGCIATSVPSERAFSKSGNVVTSKRCSLDPEIIRDTLFVSENYEEDDDNVESSSGEEEDDEEENDKNEGVNGGDVDG